VNFVFDTNPDSDPAFYPDADPDHGFHSDVDPDPASRKEADMLVTLPMSTTSKPLTLVVVMYMCIVVRLAA
jgi:hypothetical protein